MAAPPAGALGLLSPLLALTRPLSFPLVLFFSDVSLGAPAGGGGLILICRYLELITGINFPPKLSKNNLVPGATSPILSLVVQTSNPGSTTNRTRGGGASAS